LAVFRLKHAFNINCELFQRERTHGTAVRESAHEKSVTDRAVKQCF